MMNRSELAYIQDTENADTEGMSIREKRRAGLEITEEDRKREMREGLGQAASLITDVLPFVGTAKAATELPEDISYVQDLLAAGYEEGDIKKMGLGGTMAVLTGLGFIPGVKLAADVGKRAIKEGVQEAADELGTQTRRAFGQEALISPRRQAQLDAAARLPASERRKYLKEVNRPDQIVFHGAKSMGKPESMAAITDTFNKRVAKQIDESFPYMGNMATDPDQVRFMKPDEYLDYIKFKGLKYIAMRPDGEFDTVDIRARKNKTTGEIEVVHIHPETMEESDVVLATIPKEDVDMLENMAPTEKAGQALQGDLQRIVKQLSETNSDLLSDFKTRKERVLAQGFDAFEGTEAARLRGRKFEGAEGMAGEATGSHYELTHDLLSTSRAPGVSMKPAFGGRDTKNIVYAPVKPEQVRDMTPEEYDRIRASGGSEELPPLEEGQIGYSLPKSTHVEDEIAVRMPEELEVKDLETEGARRMVTRAVVDDAPSEEFVGPPRAVGEDKSLRDLVAAEQAERDELYTRFHRFGKGEGSFGATSSDGSNINVKDIRPGREKSISGESAYILHRIGPDGELQKVGDLRQMAYNNVRKYLNDMLGLSRFSRGQGTTDSYDEMMDEFFDVYEGEAAGLGPTIRALSESLPDGQRRNMMIALDNLAKIGKSVDSVSVDARDYSQKALRDVPDGIVMDVLYEMPTKNKRRFATRKGKPLTAETRRQRMKVAELLENAALRDGSTENLAAATQIGRADLKRMLMMLTQNMSRGGLMTPR